MCRHWLPASARSSTGVSTDPIPAASDVDDPRPRGADADAGVPAHRVELPREPIVAADVVGVEPGQPGCAGGGNGAVERRGKPERPRMPQYADAAVTQPAKDVRRPVA